MEKKDKILEIIKLIRNSSSNEEGKKILLQNFQELLADEEINLMIEDNRRKGPISKFFDGDFSSMEKWFADHVEELREDFEWKKKLETKEIIKNDTNYIEWLVNFMKREKKFDDDTWLYCNKDLIEKDKENVAKIDSFVDVIVDYADEKDIPSINNDYGYSYNVKYKDTVLKISVLHGQRIITDIELITNEVPEELLDFEDIIKDSKNSNNFSEFSKSKTKKLTKTRTEEKNATKQD